MNINPLSVTQTTVLFLASAFCLSTGLAPATAAADASDTEFPYAITLEKGAAEFASGDDIVITSMRGNRKHVEPAGRYLLEGSYTLSSASSADLAWFTTSRSPSGSTPVTDDEHVQISRGSGSFRLTKTLLDDGWMHVSFYLNGASHGGIYFGEQGLENTVLRKKGWSDFSKGAHGKSTDTGKAAANERIMASDSANLAIIAYLGEPVSAPSGLDGRYSPTNLVMAFSELTRQAGLRVQQLVVDDSEFPFLMYGVLEGKHDFRELQKSARELTGYDYGGSVVGTTDKGSTYFSLNIIPYNQYPGEQAAACNRRLMIRLQMVADRVRQQE